MNLNPCLSLSFNGNCEAAFQFYERCLDAKIMFMLTWGSSPMSADAPTGFAEKILHGRITVGGTEIVGVDVPPQQYQRPAGFSVLLNLDDPAGAERIFNALAENGTVQLPLQKTFWAERFGVLVDQFGIPWEINCGQPA